MNVEELLKEFKSSMIIKESDDFAIFGLPFFYLGHPEGIALRLTYRNGELTVSDCHSTTDYLYDKGVYLEDYPDKLAKIMKKFDVYLDGEVFRKVIHISHEGYDNTPVLNREIGYFIQAISIIAHIEL